MKIGYPCQNRTLAPAVSTSRTFRLASWSPVRFRETVAQNLEGLRQILECNVTQGIGFFRISSDIIPFASHPVCNVCWWEEFREEFAAAGRIVREAGLRITMHPDQFALINSPHPEIVERSIAELLYHARILDAMELDGAARIQIHVGGVYGDRAAALRRFEANWRRLPEPARRRLTVENDDRLYPVADCLLLHQALGVPVLLDFFHHQLLNRGEAEAAALAAAAGTWDAAASGLPLTDYSTQKPGGRTGAHAETLDAADFADFLRRTRPVDFDIMLEIKDKEISARRAIDLAAGDPRLVRFRWDGRTEERNNGRSEIGTG